MPSNDPKFKVYKVPSTEEIFKLELNAQKKLDLIEEKIANNKKYREDDTDFIAFPYILPVSHILEKLVLLGMFFVEHTGVNNYFYADEKCSGCGGCERICLSGKIKICGQKPVWREIVNCYFCYACLNYCRFQAVQIKSKWYMKSFTSQNQRYTHPYANAEDIQKQK